MSTNKFTWFSRSVIVVTSSILLLDLTAVCQVVRAEISGIDRPLEINRQLAQASTIEGELDLDRVQQIILPHLQNHKWERGDTDLKFLTNASFLIRRKMSGW
jgi:hypothetical protein